MSTAVAKVEQNGEILPQEQSPLEIQVSLHERYRGLASKPFKKEEIAILVEPIDSGDIEIRPDGLIYLPEIKYRRRLNQAFGPGAWALMPTDQFVAKDNVLMRPYALYVHGRFVSEAIGEQEYFPNNPQMTWATASEGAKSNAIMRCCKDIGIASELWDPGFIEKWKQQFAVKVFAPTRGQMRELWRRKDRQPLKGERTVGERESMRDVTAPEPAAPVQNNGAAVTGEQGQMPASDGNNKISADQVKRLWTKARGAGMNDVMIRAELERMKYKSSKDVLVKDYDDICQFFENWKL